jgi:hypothetical protein
MRTPNGSAGRAMMLLIRHPQLLLDAVECVALTGRTSAAEAVILRYVPRESLS